jgi:hypothetical protein
VERGFKRKDTKGLVWGVGWRLGLSLMIVMLDTKSGAGNPLYQFNEVTFCTEYLNVRSRHVHSLM